MPVRSKTEIIKGNRKTYHAVDGKAYETWEFYFGTDEQGRKIRTFRPSKAEAVKCVDDYFKALETNGCLMTALKPKDVTVGAAYAEYLSAVPPDCDMQRKCVSDRVGKWAEAYGADCPLSSVTARDVADYVAARGNAVKTRNNARSYIKSFLEWCRGDERKYLRENPCAGMKLEKEP